MNDEINFIVGDMTATTGGMVFVLSLVTCGIYALYWYYKMGEKVDYIKTGSVGNSSILYIVLGIFGFGIINLCLMQDSINQASR